MNYANNRLIISALREGLTWGLSLLFCLTFVASAAGIEVSPSKVEVQVQQGGSVTAELIAGNPTADVQLFEVYPDDFAEQIKASPASFTLEAGGRKTVTLTISGEIVQMYNFPTSNSGKRAEGNILSTNISVLARPLADTAFQANTGVKIPLTVNVTAPVAAAKPWPRWVFWAYVGCVLIAFVTWQFLSQKKTV